MTPTDKIEAFPAEPRNVVLAGIRRDGRRHPSPNWFYWDGERSDVSAARDRAKYAIFRRDPRAQLAHGPQPGPGAHPAGSVPHFATAAGRRRTGRNAPRRSR